MAGSENTRSLPAAHILRRMPVQTIHAAIDALIDELDRRAGDSDMEIDTEDACGAEDAIALGLTNDGRPGDPDDAEDNGDREYDIYDDCNEGLSSFDSMALPPGAFVARISEVAHG